jgi:hypothetical protein
MTDRHSKAEMNIDAIRENKWDAVDKDLPENASAELLTAARNAARECANDARRIVWKYAHSEEADDQGYAAEMQHAEGEALYRVSEINERCKALDTISQSHESGGDTRHSVKSSSSSSPAASGRCGMGLRSGGGVPIAAR